MSSEPPAGAVELAAGVWVRPDDVRYTYARSGGPGGQAVNKLSTRAQLRVALADIKGLDEQAADRLRRLAGRRVNQAGELVLDSDEHRSQLANRRACLKRLRALVGEAVVGPRPRTPTRPTRASVERRLAQKRRRGRAKETRRKPSEED
ncbi:MAG: alternative ribosome rescue aminoacyl-tRNA hydrolase ArfB [Planctomycetota bacterium]|jgi:ribosome-associated protein